MHLGGAELTSVKEAIRSSATDARAQKLRFGVAEILRTNPLSLDAVSKLRERLRPFASLLLAMGGSRNDGPVDPTPVLLVCAALNYWLEEGPLSLIRAHLDFRWRGRFSMRALFPPAVSISTHLPNWCAGMAFAPDEAPRSTS